MNDENNKTRPARLAQDSEQTPLLKSMIVCSFIMLSMLTWTTSPLQKLIER